LSPPATLRRAKNRLILAFPRERKGRKGRQDDAPVVMHNLRMLHIILLRLRMVVLPRLVSVRRGGGLLVVSLGRARGRSAFVVGGEVTVSRFEVVHHLLGVLLRSREGEGRRRAGRR
jgi:hypothetical protein